MDDITTAAHIDDTDRLIMDEDRWAEEEAAYYHDQWLEHMGHIYQDYLSDAHYDGIEPLGFDDWVEEETDRMVAAAEARAEGY